MRLKILIICIVTVAMLLTGCTQTQIVTKADELMANEWCANDKFGKEISLSFGENTAELKVKTKDFTGKIAGTALVDEQTVKIFDNTLKESYSFNYTLYGDKIDITYNEDTIELSKVTD